FSFYENTSWPNNPVGDLMGQRGYSYTIYRHIDQFNKDIPLASFSGVTASGPYPTNRKGFQITFWPGLPYPITDQWGSFAFGSNEVDFRDQAGAERLILQYRTAGSNEGWSTYSVGKKFDDVSGWFAFDWSGWAGRTYEMRYTTLDGAGNVLNSEKLVNPNSETVTFSSGASLQQVAQEMGGSGRALLGADRQLKQLEQGANAKTLTVRYRPAGSTGDYSGPVTLSGASVAGVATP